MKHFDRFLRMLLSLSLLSCLLLSSCGDGKRVSFTKLGIPTEEVYAEGIIARSPWDMIFFDGKLYVGSGDYDQNAGPVTVYSYDPRRDKWQKTGTIPEEEVNRFVPIGDTLYIPGIDPTEDWSFGNYYTLESHEWIKHRVIPHGIHTFDLCSFDGAFFAAIGTNEGNFPVLRSTDGGENFEGVIFQKDGVSLETDRYEIVRVYDLIPLDGTLYAIFYYGDAKSQAIELYRYDPAGNRFLYADDLSGALDRIKYNHMRITAKETLGDTLYLVTGKLYATKDLEDIREISLPSETLVCDLYKENGALYLLCATRVSKEEEDSFKTTVYRLGEDGIPYELFHLLYDVPALSLAVCGNDFYIGTGDTTAQNEKNGMILKVEYAE